jgi:adhesin HecA-like repeat protein
MRGSVPAVVVGGTLMAAGLGAAAPAAGAAVPACSVTFTGTVSNQWSNPANWSTGQVPGPGSDVCLTTASPVATGNIDIHSLQVGTPAGQPLPSFGSLTISGTLTDTSDSGIVFAGTLRAPTIDNAGTIEGAGASTITSPALSNTGTIVANGRLRLTDNPLQLQNGTLNGGTLAVDNFPASDALIVNGDISAITAGTLDAASTAAGGNIENQSGGNALASVSSVGPHGALLYGGTVTGNLVSQGVFGPFHADVLGDYTQTPAGTFSVSFGAEGSVGQTATLAGTLQICVRKTCTPRDGTTATVLTFAARNGTFTATPAGFNVTYGTTSVQAQYEGPVNRTGCGWRG